MGAVYKARDGRLGRTVAIKFLKAEHAERFEREARAIAALNHPHICTLHDVGPDYLVMEYVEGTAVRGPLPVDQVVGQALEIASALDAAHHKGIVHRDLKPANIMVTSAGIKLLDFGLAKLAQVDAGADATVTQTQAGMIVGTAAYMSPEQAEGKAADARSDIFSFGLVLYEMLSGRRAFGGETSVSTMAAILHKEPEPIAAPAELMRVVTRCLRKAPAERFQTMSEVRQALEGVRAATPAPPAVSIAVLPFSNMSGDPENEYFSDGLAEEIINALTKLPGLKVTSRTSAFAFKGRHEDIRRIGEVLSVGHILEGSVRKAGARVRITAQLISVADGCHMWSERYDREMTDIFAVQDEISQAIVDVLKVKLAGGRSMVRHQTANVAAYQAYLEGRYYYQQMSPKDVARGRTGFERAIELDPGYAAAHAALSECLIYGASMERKPLSETIARATAAAERAIQLDPTGADGYVARGFVRCAFEFRWEEGGRDYEKAIEFDRESAAAHYRRAVWYLMPLGRHEAAVAEMRRAAELDPLGLLVRTVEPMTLQICGCEQEAVPRARAAIALYPQSYLCCFCQAMVMAGAGLYDEAIRTAGIGERLVPGDAFLATLTAAAYARMGETAEPARIRARLEQAQAGGVYLPPVCLGMLQLLTGDFEQGLVTLDDALRERHVFTTPMISTPVFRTLLGPALDDVLRKMNLR
jgi:TolB-like protein/Flp pilus assembly protein TadD